MISVHQPSLALNSSDFGTMYHYRMQFNEVITRSMNTTSVATLLERNIRKAGGRLHALIINAHGMASPDGIALGTGLHLGTIDSFCASAVRGKIEKIYCCSCEVVSTSTGFQFCRTFARLIGGVVIASKDPQIVRNSELELFSFRLPQYQLMALREILMLFSQTEDSITIGKDL